jgi:hypothetical protein
VGVRVAPFLVFCVVLWLVFVFCLSSSYVLCVQCCQCLCIVQSCVYNVASVSVLSSLVWQHCTHKTGQYRDNGNIVHTRLDNTETLATLYTQDWTIQRHWQHCTHKTGQYNVASFSVLSSLVCTMLPVSLYCPVLSIQCCQCLCIVHSSGFSNIYLYVCSIQEKICTVKRK